MRPPTVDFTPPVLSVDEARRLLAVCEGKSFLARREMAMLRLLLDTGIRRAELAALTIADVDINDGVATVFGKGRRVRIVPFGRKTGQALDRYLRVRATHRLSDRPELWLGKGGPVSFRR
jgi:site-specific recombinase XerD